MEGFQPAPPVSYVRLPLKGDNLRGVQRVQPNVDVGGLIQSVGHLERTKTWRKDLFSVCLPGLSLLLDSVWDFHHQLSRSEAFRLGLGLCLWLSWV